MISLDALFKLHPAILIILAVSVLVNGMLLFQLRRRWRFYSQARHWPRLTVKADSVQLMRVTHNQVGQTTQQNYHEAILKFRYQVQGRDYSKQSVRQVGSAEAAEALKQSATLSFLYNPAQPDQTLDEIPGPAAVVATLIGLLIVNGILFGLAHNLSAFLNGGSE